MIATIGRLIDLAGVPVRRLVLSAGLGVLVFGFGVALMSSAGYLISRAAEQPPILSLTVTIVAVRFFALARPIARYLERLGSHDVALRGLGRIRTRVYERIEPLAPAQLEGYRQGELLGRFVGDVDALQGLYVRGLGPPLVALIVGAACVAFTAALLPVAAVILAAGLVAVGVVVPILAGAVERAAARRRAPARAELTAELVELLRSAPELVVYGREEATLARIESLNRELARLGRREALAAGLGDALSILGAGLTVVGVLAVGVQAHDAGTLDRVFVATLALLALSSFECVIPLQSAARELSGILHSGRRVFELVDREPAVRDPEEPRPATPSGAVVLENVTVGRAPALTGFDLRLEPGRRVALVGPSGVGKTTVTHLLLRFLDPDEGRITLAGRDIRELRQHDVRSTFALAGQDAHLFNATIRANLLLARPDASDARALGRAPPGADRRMGRDAPRRAPDARRRRGRAALRWPEATRRARARTPR